jgi:hypothetical protein
MKWETLCDFRYTLPNWPGASCGPGPFPIADVHRSDTGNLERARPLLVGFSTMSKRIMSFGSESVSGYA